MNVGKHKSPSQIMRRRVRQGKDDTHIIPLGTARNLGWGTTRNLGAESPSQPRKSGHGFPQKKIRLCLERVKANMMGDGRLALRPSVCELGWRMSMDGRRKTDK